MNILLHICCAPCAIYPIEELRRGGHNIAGFFYNPNIQPYSEYLKRKSAVEKYAKEIGINVIYSDYDIEKFFQLTVYSEDAPNRCPVCWWMRLEKTAKYAKDNGFDAFTTTLIGSPYQDQVVIHSIADEVARNAGIKFYSADFNKGFKEAHSEARAKGIYCQNYCGCVYSEKEKIEKSNKR